VFFARGWLESQRGLIVSQARQAPDATLVVAAKALRFGDRLDKENLREIPWSTSKLPAGSFADRETLLKAGDRYVTSAIEEDEPIFAWKITGPGQRATLSAALEENMKAVTIRVNDVLGVAGFVLPGDRVDVLLTREGSSGARSYVDVLLQGVKVLAVDQTADDRRDKPAVVKAVTLEVNTEEAQKLTLAATVGQLSLALRNMASAKAERTKRITLGDLDGSVSAALKDKIGTGDGPAPAPVQQTLPEAPLLTNVGVWRNLQRTEYRVRPSG
jgi:pilus assembly protein CpaB